MAKTNAQIRAAQIKKANVFIKRAFHNEEIKPQAMDVTDKGTHLEVYVLGNKKFNGHMSDYELTFNIAKGAVTELMYSSPSVHISTMITQDIVVGKRNQISNFGKSVDATANELFNEIEELNETAAQITKFNGFMHNVLMYLEDAAADGEFEFAPANDDEPAKKVPHKQAVANSRAKAEKAVKTTLKNPAKKTGAKKAVVKPAKKVAPKAEKKALAAAKKDVLKKLADKTKKVAKAKAKTAKAADKSPAKAKKTVAAVKKVVAKKAAKKVVAAKKAKK